MIEYAKYSVYIITSLGITIEELLVHVVVIIKSIFNMKLEN